MGLVCFRTTHFRALSPLQGVGDMGKTAEAVSTTDYNNTPLNTRRRNPHVSP
jgi:hypothetical protein